MMDISPVTNLSAASRTYSPSAGLLLRVPCSRSSARPLAGALPNLGRGPCASGRGWAHHPSGPPAVRATQAGEGAAISIRGGCRVACTQSSV